MTRGLLLEFALYCATCFIYAFIDAPKLLVADMLFYLNREHQQLSSIVKIVMHVLFAVASVTGITFLLPC